MGPGGWGFALEGSGLRFKEEETMEEPGMDESGMPTTLPSPADREHFQFVALDEAGVVWEWLDEELVWVRADALGPEGGLTDECSTVN